MVQDSSNQSNFCFGQVFDPDPNVFISDVLEFVNINVNRRSAIIEHPQFFVNVFSQCAWSNSGGPSIPGLFSIHRSLGWAELFCLNLEHVCFKISGPRLVFILLPSNVFLIASIFHGPLWIRLLGWNLFLFEDLRASEGPIIYARQLHHNYQIFWYHILGISQLNGIEMIFLVFVGRPLFKSIPFAVVLGRISSRILSC